MEECQGSYFWMFAKSSTDILIVDGAARFRNYLLSLSFCWYGLWSSW